MINSRGIFVHKASSAPPWYKIPNKIAASNTPNGCERPINATAIPMNPAPCTLSITKRSDSPITEFIPINPASAPDINMETIMILTGDIPAYFAALSECPNARIS